MIELLLMGGGFVALYYGAEWLVDGALEVASHLKLSKSFIGLTLVAFGTSAPELFVNLISAYRGHATLALANIAGSNLTNLCIGFGLCSFFCVVPLKRTVFLVDVMFMVMTPAIVLASFLLTEPSELSIWALLPFVGLLVGYLFSLTRRRSAAEVTDPTHLTMKRPLGMLLIGVVLLYVGGEMVYRATTQLAEKIGIDETVIGLTVVACGTSIPDVMASIVASRKGEFEIAVGNLLGSNISNVLVVLASTLVAARSSLPANDHLIIDYTVVCFLSLMFALVVSRTERITRIIGGSLIAGFVIYYAVRITGAIIQST